MVILNLTTLEAGCSIYKCSLRLGRLLEKYILILILIRDGLSIHITMGYSPALFQC